MQRLADKAPSVPTSPSLCLADQVSGVPSEDQGKAIRNACRPFEGLVIAYQTKALKARLTVRKMSFWARAVEAHLPVQPPKVHREDREDSQLQGAPPPSCFYPREFARAKGCPPGRKWARVCGQRHKARSRLSFQQTTPAFRRGWFFCPRTVEQRADWSNSACGRGCLFPCVIRRRFTIGADFNRGWATVHCPTVHCKL